MPHRVHIRMLGRQDYLAAWHAMRHFTQHRHPNTISEIWFLEHDPVFTQGQAGKPEHVLNPGDIPVIQSDRGGQVTYHGPGQLVVYLLLDLKRMGKGVKSLVTGMEASVIALLAKAGVSAHADPQAPGVYVGEKKLASLGLRVKRGYTYHGLALNVDLDLEPFSRINPCGHANQAVTCLRDLGIDWRMSQVQQRLLDELVQALDLYPQPAQGNPIENHH